MDRFDAMTLFVRIVESGSFTRAANALDIPRATATLAIQQLERRLGVRLLERTTRQVRPTLEGQTFHERCIQLLAELEDAEATLKPVASNPAGVLRVEMHGIHASQIVLPRIDEFHARYPRLEMEAGHLNQPAALERADDVVLGVVDSHPATGRKGPGLPVDHQFQLGVGGAAAGNEANCMMIA